MSYINETDFVVENKKLVYPEIVTDGLQLYYDAKGKRDTDYHRDTMLDMSGNKNHGKLHNFAYEKHSGYKDGLVFDYIDDKLVRPTLNLKPDDFTFMLNGNIISFSPDGTVKRVQDGEVIESKGFNLIRNGNFSQGTKHWRAIQGEMSSNNGILTSIGKGFSFSQVATSEELYWNESDVFYISYNVRSSSAGLKTFTTSRGGSEKPLMPILNEPKLHSWTHIEGVSEINSDSHDALRIIRTHQTIEDAENTTMEIKNVQLINLTTTFGAGNEPTLEEIQAEPDKWQWLPNPLDLIELEELKGNTLGDMENIIDGLYKTDVLTGEEIYTDKADDAVVHVDIDGKSVGGGSGKNLFYSIYSHHSNAGYNSSSWTSAIAKIEPNKTYTVSYTVTNSNRFSLWQDTLSNGIKSNRVDTSPIAYRNTTIGEKIEESITTDERGGYLVIYLSNNKNNARESIQIEEGATATAYEPPAPTPDYPIEIHSLNDFDVVSSVGKRNMIYKGLLEEGSFAWNTYAPNGGGNTTTNLNKRLRSYIPIEPSTNYYVSTNIKTTDGKRIEIGCSMIDNTKTYVDGFGRMIETPNDFNGFVFKTAPNARLARFRFGNANSGNNLSFDNAKFVLVKSNTPVPYSKAPEDILESDNHPLINKINLLLDEPLRSVGDVKDRLFRDSDGLWKVERNIHEVILDGSESWSTYLNATYNPHGKVAFRLVRSLPENKNKTILGNNSHFNQGNALGTMNGIGNITGTTNYSEPSWTSMNLYIVTLLSVASTESEFKSFLTNEVNQGRPVIHQYAVENPTIETLDQELQDKLNNLRSFEDSNYVYTVLPNEDNYLSNNLKPTLHAKFLYNNWYKEDRVINNLMIYNRALTNEEMLQNYKTIKRRWGM